jgi:selenocysteine-specific elongation factor
VRARAVEALDRHHARAPDEPGLNSARLQRMAFPAQSGAQATLAQVPPVVWQAWIERLLAEGEPVIERTGQWLHRPGHRVTLSEAERTLSERLLPLLAAGGNDPPWVRDLARSTGTREDAVRELLRKQARLGRLYQVVKDLFYPAERVAELASVFAELAARARGGGVIVDAGAGERAGAVQAQVPEAGDEEGAGIAGQAGSSTQARGPVEASVRRAGRPPHRLPPGAVEARVFRDAVQLGRKRAIQILEFFDRIGYTRRVGDAHLLRPDTRWAAEGPAVDHHA